jgi:hypothetical protein
VLVEARGGAATIEFPLTVTDAVPHRWLWIRIAQRTQVVLQLELALVPLEEKV